MPQNEDLAASICDSIAGQHNDDSPSLTEGVSRYFNKNNLVFTCPHEDQFKSLRSLWKISESEYLESFQSSDAPDDEKEGNSALVSKGDMGFSGSTFFTTSNGAFLVKSVPRHFEHSFFKDELLLPYADHMRQNPSSLLVRTTDFLQASANIASSALGSAPAHHIVMENSKAGEPEGADWETWDLKPMSYFYPERDVAGGALASEEAKGKLADDFESRLSLSLDDAEEFKATLQKDTAFLAKCNAVDYSLFLVRIPSSQLQSESQSGENQKTDAERSPDVATDSSTPSWRTGVKSADGKWVYRACVLDFFWAKHKVHAQAMTGLIGAFNFAGGGHGPMSVTTTSEEYRERFLKMCEEMIEVG